MYQINERSSADSCVSQRIPILQLIPIQKETFRQDTEGRTEGQTEGQTNGRTISSSYFRQAVNSLCETIKVDAALLPYSCSALTCNLEVHQTKGIDLDLVLNDIDQD